jgi:putative endonuclease
VDCRAEASAEADIVRLASVDAASYDSASQPHMRGNFCYVYVLQSTVDEKRFYTGLAADLPDRIAAHNRGHVRYTSQWKPWILKTYIAFRSRTRASEFERYLKSASGRAFVKKHL